MAYSSTLVNCGSGPGLVTAAVDATGIGKISTLITTTQILDTPILDSVLLWRILLISGLLCLTAFGLYELELFWGASEAGARTVTVTMCIVGEAFYLMNCRSLERSVFSVGLFTNPRIWLGIGAMAMLQLAFFICP